eukprot:scaffold29786_cov65-Phaeocystis_antarctica.AAC.4
MTPRQRQMNHSSLRKLYSILLSMSRPMMTQSTMTTAGSFILGMMIRTGEKTRYAKMAIASHFVKPLSSRLPFIVPRRGLHLRNCAIEVAGVAAIDAPTGSTPSSTTGSTSTILASTSSAAIAIELRLQTVSSARASPALEFSAPPGRRAYRRRALEFFSERPATVIMGCGSSTAKQPMPGSVSLAIGAAAGPRVFTAPKCQPAWTLLEGTPEAAAIERLGIVLKQGMSELRALFALFLFNPVNQAAKVRQPVLDRLILLKQQALPLIAQVDACTEQAYARVPGEPASIAAAQSGATQPIPECFEGGGLNINVPKDKWSPEVSAVVVEAARMISSGEHKAEAVHVDADDTCWRMVRDAPEEDKEITPLNYLQAQHLVISTRFHAQMEALLSPHGEYRAARMKSNARCMAKTSVDGDYGAAALEAEGIEVHEPRCRHLKDVLRCRLVLADHAALGKAHAALLAKHTPVGTKDRRLLPPRDVLQTVWFEGLIVEVQFHFAAVMNLKVFSHAAYNISRVQTEQLTEIAQLFDHPVGHLEKAEPEDVTSKLHF